MGSTRTIGKVTVGATTGATTGAALAQITVWVAAQAHVDMAPIEGELTVVLTAALGLIGGWLVKPSTPGRHEA